MWVKDDDVWAVLSLDGDPLSLRSNPPLPVRGSLDKADAASQVISLRAPGLTGAPWVLMAGAKGAVRVNGIALATGMRVLADRDEIRVGSSHTLFFSAESLARIEPFVGANQRLFCPRCKQEIVKEAMAVMCPACGVWHHQSDDLPCWTYSSSCALCPQPTDLNAGYRWTPEEL